MTLKHKVKIFLTKRSFDSCSPRVPRARPQQGLVLARTLPGAAEESRGLFIYHIKAARSCSPNEEHSTGLLSLPMQHGSSSSDGAQARAPFYTNI